MAPGHCAICLHDRQNEINAALIAGTPYRKLSAMYGMSINAISRHRRIHLGPGLVKVQKARAAQGAATTLDQLEALTRSATDILHRAEEGETPNPGMALSAVREARATLELRARLLGEIDDRPVANISVMVNPQWLQIRGLVMKVMAPYPEALEELDRELARIEGEEK